MVDYTGPGDDGQIDPNRPSETILTNDGTKFLHDDELKIVLSDGTMVVIPSKDIPQDMLELLEKQSGKGGFASGGIIDPITGKTTTIDPNATSTIQSAASQKAPVLTPQQSAPKTILPPAVSASAPAASPATTTPATQTPAETPAASVQPSSIASETMAGLAAQQQWDRLSQGQTIAQNPNLTSSGATALQDTLRDQQGSKTAATAATLAQNDITNKQTLLQTQLSSGDYKDAAATMAILYPGSNIDFSSLITAKNAANLTSAMSSITTYATTAGMTVDKAYDLMNKSGALTGTNLSKTDFTNLFNAAQVQADPIAKLFAGVTDAGVSDLITAYNSNPNVTNKIPTDATTAATLKSELAMFALQGGYTASGLDPTKFTSADAASMPLLQKLLGQGSTSTYANYTFKSKNADGSYTFTDNNGKTISMSSAQVAFDPTLSGLAGVPTQTFNADATYGSSTAKGGGGSLFNEGGNIWTAQGQTEAIPAGTQFTLDNAFGVQNSNVQVPKGDYVSNPDQTIGGITIKSITAVDGPNAGKTYVINSPSAVKLKGNADIEIENGALYATYQGGPFGQFTMITLADGSEVYTYGSGAAVPKEKQGKYFSNGDRTGVLSGEVTLQTDASGNITGFTRS